MYFISPHRPPHRPPTLHHTCDNISTFLGRVFAVTIQRCFIVILLLLLLFYFQLFQQRLQQLSCIDWISIGWVGQNGSLAITGGGGGLVSVAGVSGLYIDLWLLLLFVQLQMRRRKKKESHLHRHLQLAALPPSFKKMGHKLSMPPPKKIMWGVLRPLVEEGGVFLFFSVARACLCVNMTALCI